MLSEFYRSGEAFVIEPNGQCHSDVTRGFGARGFGARGRVVVAGSFNPLHEGHLGLAAVATEMCGLSLGFELCIRNVDKPTLAEDEVRRRAEQFQGRYPLWITRAARFGEKSLLFPDSVFAVGADTAFRVVQRRYYEDREALAEALRTIRDNRCRFLVAARSNSEEGLLRLADLEIPSEFADLFEPIPESRFRMDISSTELRQQQEPNS